MNALNVPLEIVREIISHLDAVDRGRISDAPGMTSKQRWALYRSLSLASRDYRALTLAAWFRVLFVKSPSDLSTLDELFPSAKTMWTRELHCVRDNLHPNSPWDLQGFRRLKKIRFDSPASPEISKYSSSTDDIPFVNVPSSVEELDLRGLQWPSPIVFSNIGTVLPDLKVIRMKQNRIWCGLCHTCSFARFRSPGPDVLVYEGGLGLPMHYARAFSSLSSLHTVYITIADLGSGRTVLSNEKNEYLWTGECDRCMQVMYGDEAFRDRWIARKRGDNPEGTQNVTIYVRPPKLKRVEWRFWKTSDNGEDQTTDDEAGFDDDETDFFASLWLAA